MLTGSSPGSPLVESPDQVRAEATRDLYSAARIVRAALGIEPLPPHSHRAGRDFARMVELSPTALGMDLTAWARLLASLAPDEYAPALAEPTTPTTASPGSEGRIEAYRLRKSADEQLHHAGDVRSGLLAIAPGMEPDLPPSRVQNQPQGHDLRDGTAERRRKLSRTGRRRWSLQRGGRDLFDVVELHGRHGLEVFSISPAAARPPGVAEPTQQQRELVAV